MKKVFLFAGLLLLLLGCVFFLCKITAISGSEIINMDNKKVLVAYYSYTGNTEALAKKIQNMTNADLFEIVPKTPYSKDYNTVVAQAKEEKQKNYMPELVSNGDVTSYDIIFIGTPVWWYTMASPVKTFIANNNFDGKIIIPFCTHGGGGSSLTYSDIKKLAPHAKVLQGYEAYERSAKVDDIKNWIINLKF